MANKREILGSRYLGAEMLESEAVREIFTLRRLGWGIKRIARERVPPVGVRDLIEGRC